MKRSRRDLPYAWIKYGMTWERYDELMEEQQGRCAICGRTAEEAMPTFATKYVYLVPDHNHKTGQARGLLCFYCNTRLGFVEKFAGECARYLKKWRARAAEEREREADGPGRRGPRTVR